MPFRVLHFMSLQDIIASYEFVSARSENMSSCLSDLSEPVYVTRVSGLKFSHRQISTSLITSLVHKINAKCGFFFFLQSTLQNAACQTKVAN